MFKLLMLFLIFLLLSFSPEVASVYMLMIIADYIWWKSDDFVTFPTERTAENRKMSIFKAMVAYLIFMGISIVILKSTGYPTQQALTPLQSFLDVIAATTPVLKGSTILTFITWVFIIPPIESRFFFGRVFEGLAEYSFDITGIKINLKRFTVVLIVLILIISSIFTLYHITAKNLQSIPLLISFVFAFMSCVLVVQDQELKSCILFHIINNFVGVAGSFGLLAFLA